MSEQIPASVKSKKRKATTVQSSPKQPKQSKSKKQKLEISSCLVFFANGKEQFIVEQNKNPLLFAAITKQDTTKSWTLKVPKWTSCMVQVLVLFETLSFLENGDIVPNDSSNSKNKFTSNLNALTLDQLNKVFSKANQYKIYELCRLVGDRVAEIVYCHFYDTEVSGCDDEKNEKNEKKTTKDYVQDFTFESPDNCDSIYTEFHPELRLYLHLVEENHEYDAMESLFDYDFPQPLPSYISKLLIPQVKDQTEMLMVNFFDQAIQNPCLEIEPLYVNLCWGQKDIFYALFGYLETDGYQRRYTSTTTTSLTSSSLLKRVIVDYFRYLMQPMIDLIALKPAYWYENKEKANELKLKWENRLDWIDQYDESKNETIDMNLLISCETELKSLFKECVPKMPSIQKRVLYSYSFLFPFLPRNEKHPLTKLQDLKIYELLKKYLIPDLAKIAFSYINNKNND
jgi:hypothetical protein